MEGLLEREETAQQPSAPAPEKKKSRFLRGYLIFVAVLAVIFAAALALLWGALARYQENADTAAAERAAAEAAAAAEREAALREREARQEAFLAFADDTDAAGWAAYYLAAHPDSPDTVETAAAALAPLFAPEGLERYKAESWTEEAPVYELRRDGIPLARVAVEKRDGVWSVGAVEMLVEGTERGSVTVPAGCTVYCSGTALGDKFITETAAQDFDFPDYAASLQNAVQTVTYTVENLLATPEFSVEPPAGALLTETAAGDYRLALPDADAAPLQERAEALVRALVWYYLSGGTDTYKNMKAAADLTEAGSSAHAVITQTYDGVTWSSTFQKNYRCAADAGDAVYCAENCVTVDVKCDASGSTGWQEKTMDGGYRICFLLVDGEWGIYGLETL